MDSRTVRILTIAVWTVTLAVLVGLFFMRAINPPANVATSGTAGSGLPIVYEFTTST